MLKLRRFDLLRTCFQQAVQQIRNEANRWTLSTNVYRFRARHTFSKLHDRRIAKPVDGHTVRPAHTSPVGRRDDGIVLAVSKQHSLFYRSIYSVQSSRLTQSGLRQAIVAGLRQFNDLDSVSLSGSLTRSIQRPDSGADQTKCRIALSCRVD